ncbi:uncharacterized protein MONOS_17775 [Monocercomonoides exilis]|uniref:uncharacterized protein n=1 Tax=Monocercomonoides exilis TaxID=2049356 RepID=UPI00355ACCCD|nr:hypothetical protein MONOS_17775 [Monocercomonoides exilis]
MSKEMSVTEKFTSLFDGLEKCDEEEQMQKIKEMNGLIDEMNEEELLTVFTIELFNKIHQMIEIKTLSLENAILLLKHVGYCKILKFFLLFSFDDSLLSKRMREILIDKNGKKKDEKHLIDVCECFALLIHRCPYELISICVPCLLKVALNKEENEETQKEAEIALLALSHISTCYEMKRELYLKEIKEIIEYHQEHRNLTRLAYQTAWKFLMSRFFNDDDLEEVIVNELHFAREAARELEELTKCVNWKKKEEENGEKEAHIIGRWLFEVCDFFDSSTLQNDDFVGLIASIVQTYQSSRDNYPYTCHLCLSSLRRAIEKKKAKIDTFAKEGIIVLFSEEMKQSTLDDDIIQNGLNFFLNISERLKKKTDGETDETKRKVLKRKIFEKMEKDGFEDIIASFCGFISFVNENGYRELSKIPSEYLMHL